MKILFQAVGVALVAAFVIGGGAGVLIAFGLPAMVGLVVLVFAAAIVGK